MLMMLGFVTNGWAQTDSLYVALLTCAPGTDAYKLFGHTAIRVRNERMPQEDWAFNYGIFDFHTENFIYRFVKGETDYVLSAEPTEWFFERYSEEGIAVTEQELELTDEQKTELARLLLINAQPENRTYRYNFLYDNCTTRARDKIEEVAAVHFAPQCGTWLLHTTFRDVLHNFTKGSPWTEFGIDLVLGSEVDHPLTFREGQFIPSSYKRDLTLAFVTDSVGQEIPFVRSEHVYEPTGTLQTGSKFPLSPMAFFWIVCGGVMLISLVDVRRRRLTLAVDIVLLVGQGIAGVLVSFLFFFSEHPAVGSNWLVVMFNPLVFVLLADVIWLHRRRKVICGIHRRDGSIVDFMEIVNMAVLLFVLLLNWLPLQQLHPAMLPLVLTLLLRSATRMRMRIPKKW